MRPERLTTESPLAGTTPQTSEPKVRISDGLAAAREQANAAWEHLTSVCAEAQKKREAIDETVRQANIKWSEAYRNVKTQEAANAALCRPADSEAGAQRKESNDR